MSDPEAASILGETPSSTARCPFQGDQEVGKPASSASSEAATFVALSKFIVANDKIGEVKEAFRHRPHLVDGQKGFVRLEVFSPLDRLEEIWLITYWTTADNFDHWFHSHLYGQAHKGIPRGLKLVPGQTEIRHFDLVST